MPIERAEIKFYGANATTGVLNKANPLGDNILAQVFGDVTDAERQVGTERNYKLFWNFEDPENLTAKNLLLYLFKPLTGDVVASLVYADHSDLWADVSASQKFGCANVAPGVTLTAGSSTSVLVNTRGQSYAHFVAGMKTILTNKADIDDLTGTSEVLTIQSVSWNGDQATVTFTTPVKYSYADSRTVGADTVDTRLSSCVEFEDIQCGFSVTNNTSAHGTTDSAALLPRNFGAIHQTITATFDDANNFSAVSSTGEVLNGGNKLTTWQPLDASGNAYMAVPSTFWTNDGAGDWSAGDSVQIHTTPAAARFFVHLDVPINAAPIALETPDIFGLFYSGSV